VVPLNTWPTTFTAPSNKLNATVTATVRDEKIAIAFEVLEPTGIKATKRSSESFSAVGAGMFIDVLLLPQDVSFYRLEVIEPAEATTGIDGYFTSHTPPTHAGHGAGDPHPVNCDNKILGPPLNNFDHAWSAGWTAPFGNGGRYTWPIHPVWRIAGTPTTQKPLSGWTDQVHILSSDGTMEVDKFGLVERRHP